MSSFDLHEGSQQSGRADPSRAGACLGPWTVIVPLKAAAERKSRLAGQLTASQRRELSERLFERVVRALAGVPAVRRVVVLAPQAPPGWSGAWLPDGGRGLNEELTAGARALGECDLAVIHADLPRLCADDVAWLLAGAVWGSAIAPDRHGTGTNALALRSTRSFRFAFGPGSFALHAGQLPGARVVRRAGFSFDLDTPEDLDLAVEAGVLPIYERPLHA